MLNNQQLKTLSDLVGLIKLAMKNEDVRQNLNEIAIDLDKALVSYMTQSKVSYYTQNLTYEQRNDTNNIDIVKQAISKNI